MEPSTPSPVTPDGQQDVLSSPGLSSVFYSMGLEPPSPASSPSFVVPPSPSLLSSSREFIQTLNQHNLMDEVQALDAKRKRNEGIPTITTLSSSTTTTPAATGIYDSTIELVFATPSTSSSDSHHGYLLEERQRALECDYQHMSNHRGSPYYLPTYMEFTASNDGLSMPMTCSSNTSTSPMLEQRLDRKLMRRSNNSNRTRASNPTVTPKKMTHEQAKFIKQQIKKMVTQSHADITNNEAERQRLTLENQTLSNKIVNLELQMEKLTREIKYQTIGNQHRDANQDGIDRTQEVSRIIRTQENVLTLIVNNTYAHTQ
jgi:hypothetical protein